MYKMNTYATIYFKIKNQNAEALSYEKI